MLPFNDQVAIELFLTRKKNLHCDSIKHDLRKREIEREIKIDRQKMQKMSDKEIEKMESFLEYGTRSQASSNICERCMRKKFKCVIIFMLTIITLTQLFMTIFEKIDEENFNTFLNYIRSKNSTFWPSLINRTQSYVQD